MLECVTFTGKNWEVISFEFWIQEWIVYLDCIFIFTLSAALKPALWYRKNIKVMTNFGCIFFWLLVNSLAGWQQWARIDLAVGKWLATDC